jgi:hypothetical protein
MLHGLDVVEKRLRTGTRFNTAVFTTKIRRNNAASGGRWMKGTKNANMKSNEKIH